MCDIKASKCSRWCACLGAGNHCNASDTPYYHGLKLAHENAKRIAQESATRDERMRQHAKELEERRIRELEREMAQELREDRRLLSEREEQRLAHDAGQLERQRQLVWSFPIPDHLCRACMSLLVLLACQPSIAYGVTVG